MVDSCQHDKRKVVSLPQACPGFKQINPQESLKLQGFAFFFFLAGNFDHKKKNPGWTLT
jgi:hypothetical protein